MYSSLIGEIEDYLSRNDAKRTRLVISSTSNGLCSRFDTQGYGVIYFEEPFWVLVAELLFLKKDTPYIKRRDEDIATYVSDEMDASFFAYFAWRFNKFIPLSNVFRRLAIRNDYPMLAAVYSEENVYLQPYMKFLMTYSIMHEQAHLVFKLHPELIAFYNNNDSLVTKKNNLDRGFLNETLDFMSDYFKKISLSSNDDIACAEEEIAADFFAIEKTYDFLSKYASTSEMLDIISCNPVNVWSSFSMISEHLKRLNLTWDHLLPYHILHKTHVNLDSLGERIAQSHKISFKRSTVDMFFICIFEEKFLENEDQKVYNDDHVDRDFWSEFIRFDEPFLMSYYNLRDNDTLVRILEEAYHNADNSFELIPLQARDYNLEIFAHSRSWSIAQHIRKRLMKQITAEQYDIALKSADILLSVDRSIPTHNHQLKIMALCDAANIQMSLGNLRLAELLINACPNDIIHESNVLTHQAVYRFGTLGNYLFHSQKYAESFQAFRSISVFYEPQYWGYCYDAALLDLKTAKVVLMIPELMRDRSMKPAFYLEKVQNYILERNSCMDSHKHEVDKLQTLMDTLCEVEITHII